MKFNLYDDYDDDYVIHHRQYVNEDGVIVTNIRFFPLYSSSRNDLYDYDYGILFVRNGVNPTNTILQLYNIFIILLFSCIYIHEKNHTLKNK